MTELLPLRHEQSAVPWWAAEACAAPAALIAATVVAGWTFHRPVLASFVPGYVTTKPAAAVALLLLAGAVAGLARAGTARAAVDAAAGAAALIGLATLLEYTTGRSLGIDQLLFHEAAGSVETSAPGRMSGNTALALLLAGGAVLAAGRRVGPLRPARPLAAAVGAIALGSLIGYASGVASLTGFAGETRVSVPSAIALLALAVGLLAVRPEGERAPRLLATGLDGRLLRRLLPLAIAVPILLTGLGVAGQAEGLYGSRLGSWIVTAGIVAALTGGSWWAAVGMARAETARLAAERETAVRAQRERLLLENLPETTVASVDEDLVLTYVSGPLFGTDVPPGPRPRVEDVLPREELWELLPRLLAALAGERQSFEWASDRTARRYRVEALPLAGDGAMLVVQDATLRIALEERAAEAQREQGVALLAAGVAHDFNNLLLAILGNAELARRALADDSGAAPHLAAIVRAADQAGGLTRALLAYAGRGDRTYELLSLTEVAREVSQLAHSLVPPDVELALELDEELPLVRGDPTQLRQVVLNLIVNAAEAIGPKPGRITVRTLAVDGSRTFLDSLVHGGELVEGLYACVEVEDTGPGVDPQTRSRIFDPFFTTKATGSGLGLAAVEGIGRSHGGGVRVAGEPGRTTFTFALPVATTAGADAEEEPAERWSASGLVLLVDDDDAVRDAVGRLLAGVGLTVVTAAGGREALALVESVPELRAAVVDLRMPGMSGVELALRIRSRRPEVPILISSGYSEESLPHVLRTDPTVRFLQKPYSLDTLAAHLRALLAWYASLG